MLATVLLSILYLRCKPDFQKFLKEREEKITFNSLFEMQLQLFRLLRAKLVFQFSI